MYIVVHNRALVDYQRRYMSIYNIDVISTIAHIPIGKVAEDLVELSHKCAVDVDSLSHIIAKNVLAGKEYDQAIEKWVDK